MVKIRYNNRLIEFSKDAVMLNRAENTVLHEGMATAGNPEFLHQYDRATVQINMRFENGLVVQNELLPWWEHVRHGQTFAMWLDDGQGDYWGFGGQTLVSNNHFTGGVARTTIGAGLSPFQTLVNFAATGEPRFAPGKYGGALVVEPTVRNYIDNSVSLSSWTTATASLQQNITFDCAPDGSFTAAWMQNNATSTEGGIFVTNARGANNSSLINYSVWGKSLQGDTELRLLARRHNAPSTNMVDTTITLGNAWTRIYGYTLSNQATGGTIQSWLLLPEGQLTSSVLLWQPQIEEGISVPTGEIRTEGSSVLRQTEVATLPVNTDLFRHDAGTLGMWIKPRFHHNDGRERWILQLEDDNGKDFIRIVKNSAGNLEINMRLHDDSANATQIATSPSTFFDPDTWVHLVIVWDMGVGAPLKFYVDGSLFATDVADAFVGVSKPTKISLGRTSASASYHISELDIKTFAMSAGDVLQYYNESAGRGIGRQFYSQLYARNRSHAPALRPGAPKYEFAIQCAEYL